MRRVLMLLAFALIVAPAALVYRWWTGPTAQDPQPATCLQGAVSAHPAAAEAADVLAAALAADGGTAISAAVVIDGELVFAGTVAREGQLPALGPGSRFRTGSVAKLFTAVAAARLAQSGRLDLNQGIAELVPEMPRGDITPYQLGTHSAGIRHYDFGNLAEANNQVRYASPAAALELFAADPLVAEPGEAFHYSSHGYNLLGVVVARAFGGAYQTALHELVAAPLGLDSLAIDDVATAIPCRASFSTLAVGRLLLPTPWRDNSDLYPSGGLLVTAVDLAVFVDAVFNGEFLTAEARELLTRPVVTADGKQSDYAFGVQLGPGEDGQVAWYGHGGETNGAYASVRYYPSLRMTVAAMSAYNYWLTSRRAAFFPGVREKLPALFESSMDN